MIIKNKNRKDANPQKSILSIKYWKFRLQNQKVQKCNPALNRVEQVSFWFTDIYLKNDFFDPLRQMHKQGIILDNIGFISAVCER